MRGKVQYQHCLRSAGRITPAHAGKSKIEQVLLASDGDHPRPCGEKPTSAIVDPSTRGSPPPMRGKVWNSRRGWVPRGITPAHAGKSCTTTATTTAPRDHPRPCGEKCFAIGFAIQPGGSPPPMRGKGVSSAILPSSTRITPAHAGKRTPTWAFRYSRRDHPRPCGEKIL